MLEKIISRDANKVTIQVTVSLKKAMLESEQSIVDSANQVSALATKEALIQFSTGGSPITIDGTKFS